MRKVLVYTAVLASMAVAAPGAAQSPISAGPLIGVNMSDVTGDDFSDFFGGTSTRIGFAVGAFAEFGLTDMVSLRPELVYTQKGTKIDEDPVEVDVKLDYIQLPVLAKILLGAPTTGARFNLLIGPAFGFSAGCTFDVDAPIVLSAAPSLATAASMIELDCDEIGADAKGFELAGILGAGVDIDRFTFDLRFDRGFSAIFDTDVVDSKNQTFSVRAGYKFRVR
jgi:hypothetical protein